LTLSKALESLIMSSVLKIVSLAALATTACAGLAPAFAQLKGEAVSTANPRAAVSTASSVNASNAQLMAAFVPDPTDPPKGNPEGSGTR
jgi:hypothetical protein